MAVPFSDNVGQRRVELWVSGRTAPGWREHPDTIACCGTRYVRMNMYREREKQENKRKWASGVGWGVLCQTCRETMGPVAIDRSYLSGSR